MTGDDAPLAVDVRDVTLTYRPTPRMLQWLIRSALREPVTALDGVTLQLRPGEVCGVIGPNGAGKSTLFRVLVGLLTPSEGRVHVLGLDARSEHLVLHRRVGFMPADDRTLFLRYSCEENLQFHARLHGLDPTTARHRIDELLRRVGIADAADRAVTALSSGMRSRLLLARAMLHRPALLVLDEPTGPLDPVAAHDFTTMLRDVASTDGVAILVSSHRMEDIHSLPSRVVLLHRGRILHDGPVAELADVVATPVTLLRLRDAATRDLVVGTAREQGMVAEQRGDHDVAIRTPGPVGPVLKVLADVLDDVLVVERTSPGLRDVMAALTGPQDG